MYGIDSIGQIIYIYMYTYVCVCTYTEQEFRHVIFLCVNRNLDHTESNWGADTYMEIETARISSSSGICTSSELKSNKDITQSSNLCELRNKITQKQIQNIDIKVNESGDQHGADARFTSYNPFPLSFFCLLTLLVFFFSSLPRRRRRGCPI